MPYVNERGVLSESRPWGLSRFSDLLWDFFNVAGLFFRTLVEPLVNAAGGSQGNSNNPSRGGPRTPRGPRGGGFRTFSDTIASPGSFPMAGG